MADDDWPCEAYGAAALKFGAWCFLAAQLNERVCDSPAACAVTMQDERRRVYRRIQERAAAGDPAAQLLAEDFTSPEELLGGEADR